jgi:hypothetical protein
MLARKMWCLCSGGKVARENRSKGVGPLGLVWMGTVERNQGRLTPLIRGGLHGLRRPITDYDCTDAPAACAVAKLPEPHADSQKSATKRDKPILRISPWLKFASTTGLSLTKVP